jgi:hypothetical protein
MNFRKPAKGLKTCKLVLYSVAYKLALCHTHARTHIVNCKVIGLCSIVELVVRTPKFDAAKRSFGDAEVVDTVVWAKKALILANKVLVLAGTPGHMYLVAKHEKCLNLNITIVSFASDVHSTSFTSR